MNDNFTMEELLKGIEEKKIFCVKCNELLKDDFEKFYEECIGCLNDHLE